MHIRLLRLALLIHLPVFQALWMNQLAIMISFRIIEIKGIICVYNNDISLTADQWRDIIITAPRTIGNTPYESANDHP